MSAINTNSGALIARSNSILSAQRQESALTRLSSGLRINSAADDAAGMAVANKLSSQVKSMQVALRNLMDASSLIDTASSGASEITNMVIRIRELAVQMANGTYSKADRINGQLEVESLLQSISDMSSQTNFNGVNLLDGSYVSLFRAGHTNNELIDLAIRSMGIEGVVAASSNATSTFSKTILQPETLASGSSLLDYLSNSSSTGPSSLIILDESNSSGTSFYEVNRSSNAVGTDEIKLLNSSSALGSSTFLTPTSSSGTGVSNINRITSSLATGSSAFITPESSSGTGVSNLTFLDDVEATGTSIPDYLNSSRASGTSQIDYIESSIAAGNSSFNTPATSTGTKSSGGLTIDSTSTATLQNNSDTDALSYAYGTSERQVLDSTTAAGSSNLDYLSTTFASGQSTVSGVQDNSSATVTSSSTLDPFTFPNGSFSSGGSGTAGAAGASTSISGWDVHLKQISLDPTNNSLTRNIGGFATPIDTSRPNNVGDHSPVTQFDTTPIEFSFTAGSGSITLGTSDVVTTPNGQIHGPYIVSKDPVELFSGDEVYFSWAAQGSGDRADVYAYLLNVDDGTTVTLLNETAENRGATNQETVRRSINSYEAGRYKFVFVSGSFDADGGGKLGSSLTLSGVGINQADPSKNKVTTAKVSLTAQESRSVLIEKDQLTQLRNISSRHTDGSYSISGRDGSYFEFDDDLNIVSSPLLRTNKTSYLFDVKYQTLDGIQHTETVNLSLTTAQGADSNLTAQEGDNVKVSAGRLNLMTDFASRNPGTYSFNRSFGDYESFTINQTTGEISSRSPLDFDEKNRYEFGVIYTANNGQTFNNNVVLNITDTLTSSASLTAEETNQLIIAPETLSVLNSYALEDNKTGYYSMVSGSDTFQVDRNTGQVSTLSSKKLLLAEQSNYSFSVKYTKANGISHTENVALSLTEAKQASSSLSASYAQEVKINVNELEKISGYAARTGPGIYSLADRDDDNSIFAVNSNTGQITLNSDDIVSSGKLEFDLQLVFTPSNGGKSFAETISLQVLDENESLTVFSATEAETVSINISDMSSLSDFIDANAGGSLVVRGADGDKFFLDEETNTIKNKVETDLTLGTDQTYNYAAPYKIRLEYQDVDGNALFTEKISLAIEESLKSNYQMVAPESGQVSISMSNFSEMLGFKARDRNAGTFSFKVNDDDSNLFNLSNNGVTSKGAMDFTEKENYSFTIVYTSASDNRQFETLVNLQLNDTLSSTATLSSEEALSLTIQGNTLASSQTYKGENAGGVFSLAGPDRDLFNIDEDTGTITSKPDQPINLDIKSKYQLYVDYTADGVTHRETVNFTPSPAKQGSSNLSAQEADVVNIYIDDLKKLSAFASLDGNGGSYSFGTAQGVDYQKFEFNNFGNIVSKQPLDFFDQEQYVLDVKYSGSSGTFVDTVTLNLTDTLSAESVITAEEAKAISVDIDTLTSSKKYMSENPDGEFSLSGADEAFFDINVSTGIVTTKDGQTLKKSDQEIYRFNVNYSQGGSTHTEQVTLSLTEALQGASTITAHEAGEIIIPLSQLSSLNSFKNLHGAGNMTVVSAGGENNGDESFFKFDAATSSVKSKQELDYSSKSQYVFNIKFEANDGKTFTETVTLNLTDTLRAASTLTSEETETVSIQMTELKSLKDFYDRKSGGEFSLSGTDAGKFNIDPETGAIASKEEETFYLKDKSSYNFNVNYEVGGEFFVEAITLNITEALQGSASLSADESASVSIDLDQLSSLRSFRENHPFGTYSLDTTTADSNYFSISQYNGQIISQSELDFSEKSSYSFNVKYRGGDGVTFTETVNLSLNDTLNSEASLASEETKSLSIALDALSSTKKYVSENEGGEFSLSGDDSDKFKIDKDAGTITSKEGVNILKTDGAPLRFNVNYKENNITHSEAVSLTITEALQSEANVTAKEAKYVNIGIDNLEQIHAFAARDYNRGIFSLTSDNNDASYFRLNSDNTITSRQTLEFDQKSSFQFKLLYQASDNRVFTTDVKLTLEDTLQAIANLTAEQSHKVTIDFNDLESTKSFMGKYEGNTFTLSGKDANKFLIGDNNDIISKDSALLEEQESFDLNLNYTADNGLQHQEKITLKITESLQAESAQKAQEATTVNVRASQLDYIYDYASRDNFEGHWSLDTEKTDSGLFSVSSIGVISSKVALNFIEKQSYEIGLKYTKSDGSAVFHQDIDLTITDTQTSTSSLIAEEAEKVVVSTTNLNGLQKHIDDTTDVGSYSLTGTSDDFKNFTINEQTGRVTSNDELRKEEKDVYNFSIVYSQENRPDFYENVTLNLSETTYNKSQSTLSVTESDQVNIKLSELKNISRFVNNDNFSGSFEVIASTGGLGDHNNFHVDEAGNISSLNQIDFEQTNRPLEFTLRYTTDGGQIYTEAITLKVQNDLRDDNALDISNVSILSQDEANDAISLMDSTIQNLSSSMAQLGAAKNRVTNSISNLLSVNQKTQVALGRIIDADFATETANLSREMILAGAATAMLAQATQSKLNVLKLINL